MTESPSMWRFASIALVLASACTGQISDNSTTEPPPGPVPVVPGQNPGTPPGEPGTTPVPGVEPRAVTSRFVRLNHQQWENTVQDLLRLDEPLGLSSSFVAEPLRSAFDTNGSVLSVSPDIRVDYEAAAEAVAQRVARDAELTASFIDEGLSDPAARARSFVENFGFRAYRRPLNETEITRYLALFDQGATLITSGDAFADGVEVIVSAIVQSAHFLYRTELENLGERNGAVMIGHYEVASKLSYAITGSMPDDELFAAARDGALQQRETVMAHAARLLETQAGERTLANFHDQLLHMAEYETISKDTERFPWFVSGLGTDFRQESLAFVRHVAFEQNLGLSELLTAPYTFANSRVREAYGLDPAGGSDAFERVELDPAERAGILTQLGFLAAHGEGETPNTIMRGVHISDRILCVELPPPPDAIPPFPEIDPNSTNRERVEALTAEEPCNSCHATFINPLGFAFENLDGVGRYRTTEADKPVNAQSSYPLDGQVVPFNGAAELMRAVAQSQQAHDCYAGHWAEYLYGRELHPSDSEAVTPAGARSKQNASVKDVIVELVASDAFLTRAP